MARCLSCGRRVPGIHQPCGIAPPVPAVPAGPLPTVPGHLARRVLGHGGFGVVLEAERESDGVRLAVKVARAGVAGAREQLEREEAALRAVGPPAVPRALGSGVLPDGSPWLAMELVDAPSLASRIEGAGGPLPPAELAPTALALLDALAVLHAAGHAHGDLKPENVLLEGSPPRARLLDLGLARRLDEPVPDSRATLAGTAEYMAPEQCEGRAPDASSDVYAAGVLLFEMATGRTPFFGPAGEVRHAHLGVRPPRPGSLAPVPPALEELVLRCLAKAPADRFPAVADLRAALVEALHAREPVAARRAAPLPASRAARRRVGVAFLESAADALAVQAAAAGLGGVVAHAEGGRYALVFDPASDDNPVRQALRAARHALARGLCGRVRVDLVAATAQARPGGAERYLSATFSQRDAWPRAADPPGVVATARAADVLPGEPLAPLAGRDGLFLCEPTDRTNEETATVVGHGAAPLLGRDEVVAELLGQARAAAQGREPTIASVVAEAGMGKTHLAAVLSERLRAQQPGGTLIEVRARPASEAGEGGVLRALVRSALRLPPGPLVPPEDGGRALLELALPTGSAEELWAGAALALGWIDPAHPALRARAAAPGALAFLAVRAAGALLRRAAEARPLGVVLDDAHLAEASALDALEQAALAEARAPIFACLLGRPALTEGRPGLGERAARSHLLRLGPLEPKQAGILCRRLLLPAEAVPARAVEQLVERSQGVPLLLVELVRGLKRDGLVRAAQGGGHYLATDQLDRVPDMPVVEWLADRELRALPGGLAAHAQLAALLGDELERGEVAGVLAELERAGQGAHFPLDAGAATERLRALGLLVGHRGGRAGFRLPLVRDALARSVPDGLRRAIHDAAFRHYGGAADVPEPVRLRRLARHAAASGHAAEAAAVELRLAGELAARHVYIESEAHYSRALEQLPADSEQRLPALRGRALMRLRTSRYEDALADLEAARAAARAGGDRAAEMDCLLDAATALDWVNDFARSARLVEEAAALSEGRSSLLQARLDLGRGRALFRTARWAEAGSALRRAAERAAQEGDAGYETLIAALLLLGTSAPALGRAAEGEEALARAESIASGRGDLLHLPAVYINRRNLLVTRGDAARALEDQRAAARIAREHGMLGNEYMGEYNAAEICYQIADLAGAMPHLRRAQEIEQRHPEVQPLPLAMLLEARLRLFAGEGAEARSRYQEWVARLLRSGAMPGPAEEVLADMVDLASRDASAEEWDALVARSSRHSVEQEPVEVLEMRGLTALRAGRRDEAREALRGALALADRIPNLLAPRLRRALEAAG